MQSSKMSTKSFIYRFLEPFMGKGLFTSSGELFYFSLLEYTLLLYNLSQFHFIFSFPRNVMEACFSFSIVLGFQHKSQRKLLQPLFGPKVLEGYSHIFQKHATKFVQLLNSYVDKEAFDVLILLHDSAFETTMGKYDYKINVLKKVA